MRAHGAKNSGVEDGRVIMEILVELVEIEHVDVLLRQVGDAWLLLERTCFGLGKSRIK